MTLVAAGAGVALLAALGSWLDLSGSLRVAKNIAATSNPGNLQNPLRSVQIFGTWLVDSYKHLPAGGDLTVSYALAYIALAAAVLGAAYIVYLRAFALAAWLALTLAVWLGLTAYGTTWADGKALMLTSPVVVLLAWSGVAALRAFAQRPASGGTLRGAFRWVAPALALVLAGGVAVSDAMQYHGSNLAPTARYDELASLDSRFAGRGPALFTDYDEYALYELRNLDVGGPGFMFPPRSIAQAEGQPADLDQISPAALRAYPLIVTRRDPAASRPPAAYRLLWQGTYYEVWGRRPGAPAALAHVGLSNAPVGAPAGVGVGARAGGAAGGLSAQCSRVEHVARLAESHGAQLIGASPPEIVGIDVARLAPGLERVPPRAPDVATRPSDGQVRRAACRGVGPVAAGRDHAGGHSQRRRTPALLDQRPAHRCRHRPRHDGAAARSAKRRLPSSDDHSRERQPAGSRRRQLGDPRLDLPDTGRSRVPGEIARHPRRSVALAVRRAVGVGRGRLVDVDTRRVYLGRLGGWCLRCGPVTKDDLSSAGGTGCDAASTCRLGALARGAQLAALEDDA
jgi:hypothetical protein